MKVAPYQPNATAQAQTQSFPRITKQRRFGRQISVDHRLEIEPILEQKVWTYSISNLVKRTLVFTLSGSPVVDLKEKWVKIEAKVLTKFLCQLILQNKKIDSSLYIPVSPSTTQTRKHRKQIVNQPLTLSQHFQESLSISLFGMHCHIVYNDLLCVATFADVPSGL